MSAPVENNDCPLCGGDYTELSQYDKENDLLSFVCECVRCGTVYDSQRLLKDAPPTMVEQLEALLREAGVQPYLRLDLIRAQQAEAELARVRASLNLLQGSYDSCVNANREEWQRSQELRRRLRSVRAHLNHKVFERHRFDCPALRAPMCSGIGGGDGKDYTCRCGKEQVDYVLNYIVPEEK